MPVEEEFLKMFAVYCKADDKCEWTIIPWLLTRAKRLDWALTKSWNSLENTYCLVYNTVQQRWRGNQLETGR